MYEHLTMNDNGSAPAYKAKNKWGLGIKHLRKVNINLLYKWWWYLENEEGILSVPYRPGTPTNKPQVKISCRACIHTLPRALLLRTSSLS
jgi:hypothetical protein